jgi:Outer membrane protein beta-barrel family
LSAIGMGNNNNKQGFSFDDYLNFMGGLSGLMSGGGANGSSGGGRMRIAFDPAEMGVPLGQGMNNGFTTTWAGGLNFNSDLSAKTKLNGNYFYNRLRQDIDRTVTRENILSNQNFTSRTLEDRFSRNANHRMDLRLRHTVDSFQDFSLRARLNMNNALFSSLGNSETFDPFGALQNKGLRDYEADGDNFFGNASFVYRRRFGKKGRAFVADLFARKDHDTRNGDLLATNEFQNSNPMQARQNLSQRQVYTNDATSFGGTLAYTEPLGKRQYLEGTYTRQEYNNNTVKDFYDRVVTPTPGETFNPLLSNNFRRGYQYDRGGLNYMLNRNKYLTAGASLQHAELDGKLVDENIPVRFAFTRLLPNLFFNYEFGTSKNFSANYTTGVREPSLEQLQPAVDNSDPLNVYAGNPNLRPEYEHNLDFDFMLYDQFTMRSFFAGLNAGYTTDRITNASSVDSLFRRFMRPVNVEYDLTAAGNFHFSTPLKFVKSRFTVALNTTYNRGILFVNDIRNTTDRWVNSIDLSVDNSKKERLDLSFGARFTQNSTQYSVSDALNQHFINQRYFADATVFPNKKWAVGTGLTYTVYSKESFGEQRAVPILRADITRYILKNRRGQIKLTAFDIFDQNIGINRRSQFNYLEEERIQNLSRYFMLTFGYSLSGFGERRPGGIHIQARE